MGVTINGTFSTMRDAVSILYAAMPAQIVLLILGLVLCLAGCKLMKWAGALYGVVIGLSLGICVTNILLYWDIVPQDQGAVLNIAAMLIGGIATGLLSFRFPRLGIFLMSGVIGVVIGYVPATFVAEVSQQGFWALLVVFGLVFAATGAVFMRPAYVIATSLSGIAAGFALAGLLQMESGIQALAIGCGMTVVGFVVQLFLLRGGRAKDVPDSTEAEEAPAEQETVAKDSKLEDTCVVPLNDIIDEPHDDIDTISDTVAAHIGMTSTLHLEKFVVSDEPETAEDSTMVIPRTEPQEDEPAEKVDTAEAMADAVQTQEPSVSAPEQVNELAAEQVQQPEDQKTEQLDASRDAAVAAQTAPQEETMQQQMEVNDLPQPENVVKRKKQKKRKARKRKGDMVLPIILIAASLVFAAVGFQYVELMLLLCFLAYIRKHYRSLAFACAILCARREADMIPLILQHEDPWNIVPGVISGVIFLVLTCVALWKASHARRGAEE
ncbi:MAG: DUF4203 domain-containing protein [Eubacteriales bacterium]|nr:DUF4203 domain-containing protein [Eubacteriales bacterium]